MDRVTRGLPLTRAWPPRPAIAEQYEVQGMKGFRLLLASALTTIGLLASPPAATAAETPIHFADLNWESGSLITDILRIIVEKGYGLPTDTLPGTTITLETALANNDIQVCLLYTSPSPRDRQKSRMPSSA